MQLDCIYNDFKDAMNDRLPDVALNQTPAALAPLDWVGMQGIALPLLIEEEGVAGAVPARADIHVDLPSPQVKGIHMSRLYLLLDAWAGKTGVDGAGLSALLQSVVASHADCGATGARLALGFELLCRRGALVTPGLAGWKAYPVTIDAVWRAGVLELHAGVTVAYSSTCPCSAALSRQLLAQAFEQRFGSQVVLKPAEAQAWLLEHGSLATPHSQRSLAQVKVQLALNAPLRLIELIDLVETALATPVQTAVKRADEQAFARLNGGNLMYVEDAARRLRLALDGQYLAAQVTVRHLESLHAHDAVAFASLAKAGA